ncbi:6-pyruvoyl trahydropterin synthase family protein [Escherichia coli]|uniref:6-pyruvoyl trahydropterin synthase family protein n=1 Tax=Escherichia coli TaxID=562 RepID=UPI001F2D00F5|nr:6-carboxytetrahydropterin synthase [Escherichia coli]
MSYTVIRSHEICAGHRVVGHESKCRHLHGHNYKFHFKVAPKGRTDVKVIRRGTLREKGGLDNVGRVIDFSVVKTTLCQWLEDNWDHKFLHWEEDPLIKALQVDLDLCDEATGHDVRNFDNSLVSLPFNPTAENLAAYMVEVIGPQLLDEHGVQLVECTIEETSKCHVNYSL